jgi:hypothetical protein
MKNEVLKVYTTLCFILVAFVGIMSFSMIVKTNNIVQLKMEVGNLKKEIEHLNKQISEDSLTIKTMEEDYVYLFDENQIFSSMLSEIENEPGGHEILKKLWNKQR